MSVEIKVFGQAELQAKLAKLQNFYSSPRLRALLNDAGEEYRILAWRDAPRGATGMLKKGIHFRVEGFGGPDVVLRVGVGGPAGRYSHFVETGTGPSVRFARQRRFMAWVEQGNKTAQVPPGMKPKGAFTRFARKVNHSGTPAQPYFMKQLPIIRQRFMQALARIIQQEMGG